MRRHSFSLAFLLCACGSSAGGGGGSGASAGVAGSGASSSGGTGATSGSGGVAGASGAGGTSGTGGAAGAHVVIQNGELRIDGVPTFLYGGDLHYFRVRDAAFDAAKTEALWVETLDLMVSAGMNLVTTYAAWDYHQKGPGQWDFTGARDVGKFVDLACARGLKVVFKPGPLITGEWPRGFGTFGAVPAWWKQAHPEALARKSNGQLFNYSPTGAADQTQPTYLHPTYLAAVKEWYAQVLAPVKKHLGGCLVAIQVDNETNLYWGNRYGDVDYSEVALTHYRGFLQKKYTTVAALNARYGKSYSSFAQVAPPGSAPSWTTPRKDNPWYADWYWAGQALSGEYLGELRKMLEMEGFKEPDVLFFTNDSPFTLLFTDFSLRNVLVHDGPTKNPIGLAGLDLYPKQFTTNSHLMDQPFQADYFVRLFDQAGDQVVATGGYAYAAELQGGFYAYPALGQPEVRPAATDQLLARSIGRGLKGGAFYVIRDGLNADGSKYDYQAAIGLAGNTTARFTVMKRWGAFLQKHGADLLRAHEVRNRVAIVTNGLYAAPQGNLLDDMQRLLTIEQPALFGWLAAAGFNPEVLDLRLTSAATLAQQKAVFYLNPDFVDDVGAQKLVDYVGQGGLLVNFLWPGRVSDAWQATAASTALSGLFNAKDDGSWQWLNASREGTVNADFPGFKGELESYWYESKWTPSGSVTPFSWERTQPFGTNGSVVGWLAQDGGKKRAFIGTHVATRFNQDDYYALPTAEIQRATALARYLLGVAGESPIVEASGVRELAWARRSDARTYLFVINDNASAKTVHVKLHDLAALGLVSGTSYSVSEALNGQSLGSKTGSALSVSGIDVALGPESPGVVVLEKLP